MKRFKFFKGFPSKVIMDGNKPVVKGMPIPCYYEYSSEENGIINYENEGILRKN